jgi:hypothetical protein
VRTVDKPIDIVRFYQDLGFFVGVDPTKIVEWHTEDYGTPPDPLNPWDDVRLFGYTENDVWIGDPEADVCAENKVYTKILPQLARVSGGAFAPKQIEEHWVTDTGPIEVSFRLNNRRASVYPAYQDDWIDLSVLKRINQLVAISGKQFECAVGGNLLLVLCVTHEGKAMMRSRRRFPFAW